MARSAAIQAPSRNAHEIRDRFRPRLVAGAPPLGIVEQRAIDLLGRRALLVVERVASGALRASVSIRTLGVLVPVWALGRELGDEAHRVAREELERRGARPTAAGAWGTCWTVDATEGS
jgi:hypothetical protein